ncbi:MAG TPA: DUF4175 family protein, partial [Acetobacteraceae bacterium]|nr:DUF4175 family protein [Acetobacteraceae bacterium]
MAMARSEGIAEHLARRLNRQRAAMRLVLWCERLVPALFPPVAVLAAFLCLALFGLIDRLPPWPHAALLAATLLGGLFLLADGLRRLRSPGAAEVDRRLESASGLRHQPLAVLADRPARPDAAAARLWQVHCAAAAAELGRLRVGWPRPALAAKDPYALRGLLLVACAAGLVMAGPAAPGRLARAFQPRVAVGAVEAAPLLQAWITPPPYTGLAPLFLDPRGGAVAVPQGARLTVSLTGGFGRPALALDGDHADFQSLGEGSWQAERSLTQGGRLSVRRHGLTVASWDITVVATERPVAEWSEPPGPAPRGLLTRLPWRVRHQYGVTGLAAELRLEGHPELPPARVPLALPGTPRDARGVARMDLIANPWAGLPVIGRLVATDAIGQQGQSAPAVFTLPERHFRNPLARALAGIRQRLALRPDDREAAADDLDALADVPEAFGDKAGVFLNLTSVASLLRQDPAAGTAPDVVDEAEGRLWALAMALDETPLDRTARALAAARQALRQALDQPDASDALARRMQALREAIARHLQTMLRQAQQNHALMPYDPAMPHLSGGDFDRLTRQIEQAAREGRMDEARQLMAQLDRMLDALRNARPENAETMRRDAEQERRAREMMQAVQDLARRQRQLLDQGQARAGDEAAPRPDAVPDQPSLSQGAPNAGGTDTDADSPDSAPAAPKRGGAAARTAEAGSQDALRRQLEALMDRLAREGGGAPAEFRDADQAMRDAAGALQQGQDEHARTAQLRALSDLQKGGRGMRRNLARQFALTPNGAGQGEPSPEGGAGQSDAWGDEPGDGSTRTRDPLGRKIGEGANGDPDSGSDVRLPGGAEQARGREILDELRRRSADRQRSQEEL